MVSWKNRFFFSDILYVTDVYFQNYVFINSRRVISLQFRDGGVPRIPGDSDDVIVVMEIYFSPNKNGLILKIASLQNDQKSLFCVSQGSIIDLVRDFFL